EANTCLRKRRAEIDANPRSGNAVPFAAVQHGSPTNRQRSSGDAVILLELARFEMFLSRQTAACAHFFAVLWISQIKSAARCRTAQFFCELIGTRELPLHSREAQHPAQFVRLALAALAGLARLIGQARMIGAVWPAGRTAAAEGEIGVVRIAN